jgi:mannosyltransferase OCH1-like enzyme
MCCISILYFVNSIILEIIIHLLGPKDQTKWNSTWSHCYNIWEKTPYNIKLWNDEDIDNLIKSDNSDFFNIINQLPLIYKLDYVRYLILEKYGGAYFDLDVELLLDFIPQISPNRIYLVEGEGGEVVQNSIMISNSLLFSNFWKILKKTSQYRITNRFEECKNYFSTIPPGSIVRETVGPFLISELVKNMNLPLKILSFKHFNGGDNEIRFTKHHHTGIWGINFNQEFNI